MLQLIRKIATGRLLVLTGLCAVLFSFTVPFGGEGYEIYLGDKLVLQRFGENMNKAHTLVLQGADTDAQLTIKYHHCGRVGKDRRVTIKDANDRILKDWKFDDVSHAYGPMDCRIKDIVNLQKTNTTGALNLYYYSSELPKGRLLTSILIKERISKEVVK
jgi:hypothetical protein